MLTSFEIPDPFQAFVERKYADFKGMRYDFFGAEWTGSCLSCGEEFYAPNKKDYTRTRLSHSRNECLGGY